MFFAFYVLNDFIFVQNWRKACRNTLAPMVSLLLRCRDSSGCISRARFGALALPLQAGQRLPKVSPKTCRTMTTLCFRAVILLVVHDDSSSQAQPLLMI